MHPNALLLLFWLCIAVVFYTYIGYGLILYVWSKWIHRSEGPQSFHLLPEVTMVIAAYNEEGCIAAKIENTLALHYPTDKLHIIIVTDGSDDATPFICSRFPRIHLYHQPQRRGKIHAVNRVMQEINSPIVIFSDANTFLNPEAVHQMVRHYTNQAIGGVAGEKRVMEEAGARTGVASEGLYWKYESALKQMDANVYSIVGAAGELFSMRTSLYRRPPENMIIEDFYISMMIVANGFRVAYEPNAIATENSSATILEEWKRKVRIAAGAFQAILKLRKLLNPFRYGVVSFQFISHRVLRWTIAPLCLVVAYVLNFLLRTTEPWYTFLFYLQTLFYVQAFVGFILKDKQVSIRGFFVPFYFMMMNLAMVVGLFRYVTGRQTVLWERARRG